VNEKVDVYSFGVVLLELTTGKVANDGGADFCLAEWAWRRYQKGPPFNDVVDEHICDPAYMSDILSVFTLGVICTGENPPARPSMKEVLQHLIRWDRMSAEAQAPAGLLRWWGAASRDEEGQPEKGPVRVRQVGR
jgi:hypothetical protein